MSEIITKENERIAKLLRSLDHLFIGIETLVGNHRQPLSGEHFLTDREVSLQLKVSRRTLQDWRTEGKVAYILLGGKVLYKASDIDRMLNSNYRKEWR